MLVLGADGNFNRSHRFASANIALPNMIKRIVFAGGKAVEFGDVIEADATVGEVVSIRHA